MDEDDPRGGTAAKMYLEVRRQTKSKYDDKCAFMTLGLPQASGPNKMDAAAGGGAAAADSGDMQFALNTVRRKRYDTIRYDTIRHDRRSTRERRGSL